MCILALFLKFAVLEGRKSINYVFFLYTFTVFQSSLPSLSRLTHNIQILHMRAGLSRVPGQARSKLYWAIPSSQVRFARSES
jgi:hypothetical protein